MLTSSSSTATEYELPSTKSDLHHEFVRASQDIRQLQERPDNDTLLNLYALYKQSLEGDVHGCQPGFFDFIGIAKQEAWARLKGMKRDDAMRRYIALVQQLLV
jgi:acyl-CoA-binding protein